MGARRTCLLPLERDGQSSLECTYKKAVLVWRSRRAWLAILQRLG